MTEPVPVWAEWAAYQWAVVGRKQWRIGDDLNRSSASICSGIARLLAAAYPQYVDGELQHGRANRCLTVDGERRRDLARESFAKRRAPPQPAAIEPHLNLSQAVQRARREQALKAMSHGAGRVFDPDEATAPRDVWMTYRPGPGFDFMEPVRP